MKFRFLPYLLGCIALFSAHSVLAVETAPRISDREIIESLFELKTGQKNLEKRLEDQSKNINQRFDDFNQRFEDFNQRFDNMHSMMLSGFGVLAAGMFGLVGFIVWDRRTALAPVVKRLERIEQVLEQDLELMKPEGSRLTRLIHAMGELAKKDENVAQVMKAFSV